MSVSFFFSLLCRSKMIVKGQKRKFLSDDGEVADTGSPFWENQRQFVFSVSLNKYQRSQELPEPSLRRSVLIANTLRQVSLEACEAPSIDMELAQPTSSAYQEENSAETYNSSAVPANSHSATASFPVCTTDFLPKYAASCHSNVLVSEKDDSEDWGSVSIDTDFSLSAAISSILTVLDSSIDGSQQAAPRMALRSLENLSGPCEESLTWHKQEILDYDESGQQQLECNLRESNMEVAKSNHLSDLTVQDLVQDIDTSLLGNEVAMLELKAARGGYTVGDGIFRCLPQLSTSSLSPSHPVPHSVNQSLVCLPSFSLFSSLSSSSSLSLPSQPASGHNHVREGLELDHLMEILVEA